MVPKMLYRRMFKTDRISHKQTQRQNKLHKSQIYKHAWKCEQNTTSKYLYLTQRA